ncbi:hypothetical protein CRENBAI_017996 [Crenichthys baileyi]|uniref:Uncharacterized protein n=1 Tax=Crenichthys baileyi TaxID=28760 RepID=A0AAV9SP78_9TELE
MEDLRCICCFTSRSLASVRAERSETVSSAMFRPVGLSYRRTSETMQLLILALWKIKLYSSKNLSFPLRFFF